MDTTTILLLIGICVTLFGIIAAHRLTRSRNREERQIKAGKTLVESFDPTIKYINDTYNVTQHFINVLREHSTAQNTAIMEFRRHLGVINRIRFDRACHNYQGNKAEVCDLFIQHKPHDLYKILLSQIEEILKFTK